MRQLIFVLMLCSITACKPMLNVDLYTADLIEVAQYGSPIEIPIRMGLPIQDLQECESDKNKMLPALQKYGKRVTFLNCKDLSNEMHDLLFVEMIAEIIKAPPEGEATVAGMFGLSVTQQADGNFLVHLIKTAATDRALKEIDNNYQFQTIELEDIDLNLRLSNDLRETVAFEVEGVFVDNYPIDAPTTFNLERRDTKVIVPSNVKSRSIITSGKTEFLRILTVQQ